MQILCRTVDWRAISNDEPPESDEEFARALKIGEIKWIFDIWWIVMHKSVLWYLQFGEYVKC